jgi:hypothetical protein
MKSLFFLIIFILVGCCFYDENQESIKGISFLRQSSEADSVVFSGVKLKFPDAKSDLKITPELVDTVYKSIKFAVERHNDSLKRINADIIYYLNIKAMSKQLVFYKNFNDERVCFIQCFCGPITPLSEKGINFISDSGTCLFSFFYYPDRMAVSSISVSSFE